MPSQSQVQAQPFHAGPAFNDVPHVFVIDHVVVTAPEGHDKINDTLQGKGRTVTGLGTFQPQHRQFQIGQGTAADDFPKHHAVAQHGFCHRPEGIRIIFIKHIIVHKFFIVFVTAVDAQFFAKQRVIDLPVDHHIVPVPQIAEGGGQPFIIPSQPEKTVHLAY